MYDFDAYVDFENEMIELLGYKTLYDNITYYFGSDNMMKALQSVARDFDIDFNEDEDED